ncbi:MAG: phosphotransferase, partial [Planctomycetota bacterium]
DPLAAHLHPKVFEELADAAAAFYQEAERVWPTIAPRKEWDWPGLLEKAERKAREHAIVGEETWCACLSDVRRRLDPILREWDARPRDTWCHGDLHPGNIMRRDEASPWGEAGPVLLDFAETHPGHWSEDAIYMERLYWARPELIEEAQPVETLRRARMALGLASHEEDARLLDVRRVLISATVPAFIERHGHPSYLKAALGVLEETLPRVVAEG